MTIPPLGDTKILNITDGDLPDKYIYIGRQPHKERHLGNPFTTSEPGRDEVQVKSREQAILMFDQWLEGKIYSELAPARRKYILGVCHLLLGRTMVCHCKPLPCHGDVLVKHGQIKQNAIDSELESLIDNVAKQNKEA